MLTFLQQELDAAKEPNGTLCQVGEITDRQKETRKSGSAEESFSDRVRIECYR